MPPARELWVDPMLPPGGAVVALRGELDLATSPQLRTALVELIGQPSVRCVVVDMGGVTFIDSTGVHVLVEAARRLRRCGGDLTAERHQAWRLQGAGYLWTDQRLRFRRRSVVGSPGRGADMNASTARASVGGGWGRRKAKLASCRDIEDAGLVLGAGVVLLLLGTQGAHAVSSGPPCTSPGL